MSDFKIIQKEMDKHFKEMLKDVDFLYTLNLERDELWNLYTESFVEGTNEIFRTRREHDCSCCRHFIRNFGDVVVIKNGKMINVWDFETKHEVFKPVIKALSDYIKTKSIQDVFVTRFKTFGVAENHENDEGVIRTWNHFNIGLPTKFVMTNSDSIAKHKAKYRDIKNVFKRSLEELSLASIETVLELIAQNSLYKGAEWKTLLESLSRYNAEYSALKDTEKDIWLWNLSTSVGPALGKIRNHSIGTLLIDITNNVDLDVAVKKYEAIVAPTNYKRPKPIYTKKMLEDAKKKVDELGFGDSLQRRYAMLSDISVNNILFANRDVKEKTQGGTDVFAEMKEELAIDPKSFKRVEEVKIDDFIKNILPTAKNIELFVENRHVKSMVSLIAPFKADSKTMFKWDNNFSWAYTGNIADSDIKQNVKMAGGKVDGVLRFSIQWNDESHDQCDLDAHCIEPDRHLIYYSEKRSRKTNGQLDVDIIAPVAGKPAVENITWASKNPMIQGKYSFLVHCYSHRQGAAGFKAQVEYNNELYEFTYDKPLRQNEKVNVADVIFDGNNFSITERLPSTCSNKTFWNLKSNTFIPVSVMMMSPNYWNEQKGIGNKHYFFMLNSCLSEETPNGFFNEFLNGELTEHRKVFEALGTKMKVSNVGNQLSGVGFSSTQRNEVIVRVEGSTSRVIKIKF